MNEEAYFEQIFQAIADWFNETTTTEAELEEADFGFAYPDYPADHLGTDSAYLAADVMNILNNDSHTEDCTTQKQPPHSKKNTQSGGFKMSM